MIYKENRNKKIYTLILYLIIFIKISYIAIRFLKLFIAFNFKKSIISNIQTKKEQMNIEN